MALTQSITSLITDGRDYATQEFLSTTPDQWANKHMAERYGQTCLIKDGYNHFAMLCWDHLKEEYRSLRSWFTDEGKLSPLLQSKFVSMKLSGPVGLGIGWDFKPNGDAEPRMLQFKGTLISAIRAAEIIPPESKNSGSSYFGGIAKIIRAGYTARAEIHSWRSHMEIIENKETVKYSGADLSRRWVAFRTFTMLVQIGAESNWAWEASRAKALFGCIDEERNAY